MAKAKKTRTAQSTDNRKPRQAKISKELRTAVDKITQLAQEPLAREIVVAAAGAALAARKDARKAAKRAAQEAGDAIGDSKAVAGWVGAAITAAAVEAGRRLLDAYEESQGNNGRERSDSARASRSDSGKVRKPRKAGKPADGTQSA